MREGVSFRRSLVCAGNEDFSLGWCLLRRLGATERVSGALRSLLSFDQSLGIWVPLNALMGLHGQT